MARDNANYWRNKVDLAADDQRQALDQHSQLKNSINEILDTLRGVHSHEYILCQSVVVYALSIRDGYDFNLSPPSQVRHYNLSVIACMSYMEMQEGLASYIRELIIHDAENDEFVEMLDWFLKLERRLHDPSYKHQWIASEVSRMGNDAKFRDDLSVLPYDIGIPLVYDQWMAKCGKRPSGELFSRSDAYNPIETPVFNFLQSAEILVSN